MPSLLVKNAAMLVTMDDRRRELPGAASSPGTASSNASGFLPSFRHRRPRSDLSGQIALPDCQHASSSRSDADAHLPGARTTTFSLAAGPLSPLARCTPAATLFHADRPGGTGRLRLHHSLRSFVRLPKWLPRRRPDRRRQRNRRPFSCVPGSMSLGERGRTLLTIASRTSRPS